jgi:hypothetical protein
MRLPDANFLENETAYDEAVRFWRALLGRLLEKHGQREAWAPWLHLTYADGTPARDGNPIYDLLNRQRRRALRIIQYDPSEGQQELTAWLTRTYEDEFDELVIGCVLTAEAARGAEEFLDHWIAPTSTVESMAQLLRERLL